VKVHCESSLLRPIKKRCALHVEVYGAFEKVHCESSLSTIINWLTLVTTLVRSQDEVANNTTVVLRGVIRRQGRM
jgi:hypothetical protein